VANLEEPKFKQVIKEMYFNEAFEESNEEQNNTNFLFRSGVRVGANAHVDFKNLGNFSNLEISYLNHKHIFLVFKKLHPSI